MDLDKENVDPKVAKHSYSSLNAPSILQEIFGTSKFKKITQKNTKDFVDDSKLKNMDV